MDIGSGRVGYIVVPPLFVLSHSNARAWQRFARYQLESRSLSGAINLIAPPQVSSWLIQAPSLELTNPRASLTVGEAALSHAASPGGSESARTTPAEGTVAEAGEGSADSRLDTARTDPPRAPPRTQAAATALATALANAVSPAIDSQALGLLKSIMPAQLVQQFDYYFRAQDVWDVIESWAIHYDSANSWKLLADFNSLTLEADENVSCAAC